LPVLLFNFLVH